MRRVLFALLVLLVAPQAAAQPSSAQALYAERRAMLEADSACNLFTPPIRSALQAGVWQARGALLRGGWTSARLGELERAATGAARARDCADPRTHVAAARIRDSFAGWTRLQTMRFPGGERAWVARRTPDAWGWRIRQDIAAPRQAAFGLRHTVGEDIVVLLLPLAPRETAPPTAEIIIRDTIRAHSTLFEVPGRTAAGLEAGAPSSAASRRVLARERRIEVDRNGARCVVFAFPNEVLDSMIVLDPREALEIRIGGVRLLVEIGDIAAARAFLAAQATR